MNEPRQRIAIVGAGGFAREVAWLIREINQRQLSYEFVGFLVTDLSRLGEHDSFGQVLGDYNWLEANLGRVDALALGIGTPATRKKVVSEILTRFPELEWPVLIHPTARFDCASAQVGRGVIFCAGVIGTVNLVIEDFAKADTACTIGHESRLGAYTCLNPGVNVAGGVQLGEAVLVGSGAQILQYRRVGDGATVGAGAVVTHDVAAGDTVVGIPAKPLSRS